MEVIFASDHGHARGQIPDHVMRRLAQPVFIMVESKVFLHELLAGGHRNLHSAINHRWRNVLKRKNGHFKSGKGQAMLILFM